MLFCCLFVDCLMSLHLNLHLHFHFHGQLHVHLHIHLHFDFHLNLHLNLHLHVHFRLKTSRKSSQTVAKMIEIGSNRLRSDRFGSKRGGFASDVGPKRVHKQLTHIFTTFFRFQAFRKSSHLTAPHRKSHPRNSIFYQSVNPFD